MKILQKTFLYWIPLTIGLSMVLGICYIEIQQTYRLGANDPQMQIAEDASAALASNSPVSSTILPTKVDIGKSLAPFMIIYNQNRSILASSGTLDGSVPSLPTGVFTYTSTYGTDNVTWQPVTNVREAAVVVKGTGSFHGYILVARSLTEVENNESVLTKNFFWGWIGTCIVTFLLTLCSISMLCKKELV